MVFNSFEFLLIFLPLSLFGYYMLNKHISLNYSNMYLLLISWILYSFFDIKFLLILLFSIIMNYLFGGVLKKTNHKKMILLLGVLFNIGILCCFKYMNFFIINMSRVSGLDFTLCEIIMPVGISFFTFQQLAYIVDIYKSSSIRYSFLQYALHVSFFAYIISGPITKHDLIVDQFLDKQRKKINYDNLVKGLLLMVHGLAKKVLVANTLGVFVDALYNDIAGLNSLTAILLMISYTLQIYFDFSGYSEMALGVARMFNLEIPNNFSCPYQSFNISEFWKKWHISLTTFLTQYIYIPLGGNKRSALFTYINIMIVYLVSGFWHGANWTFILWGLGHGLVTCIYKLSRKHYEKLNSIIQWGLTFFAINVLWILFRSPSISDALEILLKIVSCQFGAITTNIEIVEVTFFLNLFGIEANLIQNFITIFFIILLIVYVLQENDIIMQVNDSFDKLLSPKYLLCYSLLGFWSLISIGNITSFIYVNF